MATWDDRFMISIGPRGGIRVECVSCLWFWGFHDGQALSDVNKAARGHHCSKISVNPVPEVLDVVRLGEDSKR